MYPRSTSGSRVPAALLALLLLVAILALPSLARAAAWTQLPPPACPGGPLVYDPVRDHLLLIGGQDASDVWIFDLMIDSTWHQVAPVGSRPGPRSGHSAIYDPVRDRVIVYGGTSATNDSVWALDLSGPLAWKGIAPCRPAPRNGHSATYDSKRDRMIVFGGETTNGLLSGQTWFLYLSGTPRWAGLPPLMDPCPAYRTEQSAVYDPVHDRLVVFGGRRPTSEYGDNVTWVLSFGDTVAWSQLGTAHSPPRLAQVTAVWDTVGRRVVIHGGNCTWALRDSAGDLDWVALGCAGPIGGGEADYDALRNRMVVYGGESRNETWALSLGDTTAWTLLAPEPRPSARSFHRAVYDPIEDRMLIHGGTGVGNVWALGLSEPRRWSLLPAQGAGPVLSYHAAVFDPDSNRMVIFGGRRTAAPLGTSGDLWELRLGASPTWRRIEPKGETPPPTWAHTAIYDPLRRRMLVFGGVVPEGDWYRWTNDVWALGLGSEPTWTRLTPRGTPPAARRGPIAVYDAVRDRMIVFGGEGGECPPGYACMGGVHNSDVWALELHGDPTWRLLRPDSTLAPPGRENLSAFYDPARRRLLIAGGSNGSGDEWYMDFRDMWALSLGDSLRWTRMTAGSVGRDGQSMILDPIRQQAVAFGGTYSVGTWFLDLDDAPAILMPLVEASAAPGRARITWEAGGAAVASLQRRSEGDEVWHPVGIFRADSAGNLACEDPGAESGVRYAYRLVDVATATALTEETWVTVPWPALVSLAGAAPNPSVGSLAVRFSLRSSEPATLDLLDLAGRRVVSRQVGALGIGPHTVTLGEGRAVRPGVYFVRLTQGGLSHTAKAVVLR